MENAPIKIPFDAIFVDRDGTLIEDKHYLSDPTGVCLLPHVAESLKKIQDHGIKIFIVTNQSGIGRGYFTEKDFFACQKELEKQLNTFGVTITDTAFCPHDPSAPCKPHNSCKSHNPCGTSDTNNPSNLSDRNNLNISNIQNACNSKRIQNKQGDSNPQNKNCDCRKPHVGMWEQLSKKHGLVAFRCAMIGDKKEDVGFGLNAGFALSALIATGKGVESAEKLGITFTDEAQIFSSHIIPEATPINTNSQCASVQNFADFTKFLFS